MTERDSLPPPESETSSSEEEFFEGGEIRDDPMGVGVKAAERVRRRRSRRVVMMIVFLALTAVLTLLILDELIFFFRSSTPQQLGSAESMNMIQLKHNSYVQVNGIARDMCIRADLLSDRVRFLYLLGSEMGGRILIQAPDRSGGCQGAVERTFAGRLVDLSQTARYDAVLTYYRQHFPSAPRSGPIYLLEHDVIPGQAWYYPLAVGVLIALALLNLIMARRRAA